MKLETSLTKYMNSIKEALDAAKKSARMGNMEQDYYMGMLTGIMVAAGNDGAVTMEQYDVLATKASEARYELITAFFEV